MVVRDATPDDLAGICGFGAAHVRDHYAPLIGARAADDGRIVGVGHAAGSPVTADPTASWPD
jgi:hypothetical protein